MSCRTSPISYTCLLLAPEPALAGEVPEVRYAQVLAESVCSTFPCRLGFCSSSWLHSDFFSSDCDSISIISREVDRIYSRQCWLTNRARSCLGFLHGTPKSLSALPSSTLFSEAIGSSNRVLYFVRDGILNVNRCATCIIVLREPVMPLYR